METMLRILLTPLTTVISLAVERLPDPLTPEMLALLNPAGPE